jgi:hypothetical protein
MNFIDELKDYLNSKTKEEIAKDWRDSLIDANDICPVCKQIPCESAGKWYPEDDEY